MRRSTRIGYTLIEIVVALFLFTVGGLAFVATSAVVGRELAANAVRERAVRVAANRLEILRAACRHATGGHEAFGQIESVWSVSSPDSSRVRLLVSITYPTRRGGSSDIYSVTLSCRP